MLDNDGKAVDIVAGADIEAGQFVYDEATGWAGFALDTVAEGEKVALEICRAHRATFLKSLGFAVGDVLYVQDDGTLDDAPESTARPFAKVTEVAEVSATEDQVVMVVLPQTWAKFAVES